MIDVRAVFQQGHHELAIETMPALLLPRKGRYGLRDYEKMFCPDLKGGHDIFAMRGIDREAGAWSSCGRINMSRMSFRSMAISSSQRSSMASCCKRTERRGNIVGPAGVGKDGPPTRAPRQLTAQLANLIRSTSLGISSSIRKNWAMRAHATTDSCETRSQERTFHFAGIECCRSAQPDKALENLTFSRAFVVVNSAAPSVRASSMDGTVRPSALAG